MTDDLFECWFRANRCFEKNKCDGASKRPATIYRNRTSRVCIAAVHGVNHYSSADIESFKPADLYTGGLVRVLGVRAGVSTIINYRRDPAINPYRGTTSADRFVATFLEKVPDGILLDIHGAKDQPTFDVALGTGNDQPNEDQRLLMEQIASHLGVYGLRTAMNPSQYAARSPYSLTGRALSAGVRKVLQVEIVRSFRDPIRKKAKARVALNAMLQLITALKETS